MTRDSRFRPLACAWSRATTSMLLIRLAARLSLTCIWRIALSMGRLPMSRASSFSFRGLILKFAVEYLCCEGKDEGPLETKIDGSRTVGCYNSHVCVLAALLEGGFSRKRFLGDRIEELSCLPRGFRPACPRRRSSSKLRNWREN
jgi:hypothetical protein